MAIQRIAIQNFTGGEVSAWNLSARYDIAKYKTACKKLRNFICELHGDLRRRPGTYFCADLGGPAVLIPFRFSMDPDQAYAMVFQDQKIRFAQGYGLVVHAAADAWITATAYALDDMVSSGGDLYRCTSAHTSGATTEPGVGASWETTWVQDATVFVTSPYAAADLGGISYAQSADVVYLAHRGYAFRKLVRSSHTEWALSEVTFVPTIETVAGVTVAHSASGSYTLRYVVCAENENGEVSIMGTPGEDTAAKHPSDWLTGESCSVSWIGVAAAVRYLIFREEGGYYGIVGTFETPTVARTTSRRSSVDAVKTLYFEDDENGVDGLKANDYLIVPAAIGGTGYAGTFKITSVDSAALTVTYTGSDTSTEAATAAVAECTVAYSVVLATSHRASATTTKTLYFESDGVAGFAVGMKVAVSAAIGGTGYAGTFTITAVDVAAKTITYEGASVTESKTAVVADVSTIMGPFNDVKYDADTTDTPPEAVDWFENGNYPGLVAFHQQRLIVAAATNEPQFIYGSKVGSYEDWSRSRPRKDDDAIKQAVASGSIDAIQWLASFGVLLLGTGGAEYKAHNAGEALSAITTNITAQSYWGSASLPPLIIGNSVLHLQAQGSHVRDLFYSLEKDGYGGNDISVLAPHLFDNYSLTQWAYQQAPGCVVWAVRDDGTLLGLSYLKEHEIWGWHVHETEGSFESVCALPGDKETTVYFVCKRTVGGSDKYYLERLATKWNPDDGIEDAVFLDSAKSRSSNASVSTVTGLGHLEGLTVDALVDGSPVQGLTVASGEVTLPRAGYVIHVGLPYQSLAIPMTPEADTQQGTTLGRTRAYGRCKARVVDTVGGQYGPNEDDLYDFPATPTNWGEAVQPFSGDVEMSLAAGYSTTESICIAQSLPLPFTLAALMLEVDLEG